MSDIWRIIWVVVEHILAKLFGNYMWPQVVHGLICWYCLSLRCSRASFSPAQPFGSNPASSLGIQGTGRQTRINQSINQEVNESISQAINQFNLQAICSSDSYRRYSTINIELNLPTNPNWGHSQDHYQTIKELVVHNCRLQVLQDHEGQWISIKYSMEITHKQYKSLSTTPYCHSQDHVLLSSTRNSLALLCTLQSKNCVVVADLQQFLLCPVCCLPDLP